MFAVGAAGQEDPQNAVIMFSEPFWWAFQNTERRVSNVAWLLRFQNMILWRTGLETMRIIFWQPIGTDSLHALRTKQQIKDKGVQCGKFQSSGTSRV